MSVPTATDFAKAASGEFERWICKQCGYTRWTTPHVPQIINTLGIRPASTARCYDCAGRQWHYTTDPIPQV